jgi:hypothetical protein
MRLQELSDRLFDITNYLRVPQWRVCEEYNRAKIADMRLFMPQYENIHKERALQQVYNKYERILLGED